MKRKRLLVIAVTLSVVFSLTACKFKKSESVQQESTTGSNSSVNVDASQIFSNDETTVINTGEEDNKETAGTSSSVTDSSVGTTTDSSYNDPGSWSKDRIVEEYKNAARKSNSGAKSTRVITLEDISVNNGEYDNAISFVKPIIAAFIESSSAEVDGITGGFENLAPQDVSSAKAYKNGNDTVIEMVMVEQTSGPNEDALSGSVGHAITVVGDISVVVKDLADSGLPLELSEEDTKIYYTNPTLNVVINENGEITSGTWSYTVEICMNNFKAFGQNVEKASITMVNTITV